MRILIKKNIFFLILLVSSPLLITGCNSSNQFKPLLIFSAEKSEIDSLCHKFICKNDLPNSQSPSSELFNLKINQLQLADWWKSRDLYTSLNNSATKKLNSSKKQDDKLLAQTLINKIAALDHHINDSAINEAQLTTALTEYCIAVFRLIEMKKEGFYSVEDIINGSELRWFAQFIYERFYKLNGEKITPCNFSSAV